MKKVRPTSVLLRELEARLREHDREMSAIHKVLEIQFTRIAQLQAQVDVLDGRLLDASPAANPSRVFARQVRRVDRGPA